MNYRNKISLYAALNSSIKKIAAMNIQAADSTFWWDFIPSNPKGLTLYTGEIEHHSELGGGYDLKKEGKIVSFANDSLTLSNGEKIYLDNDSILSIEADMENSLYIIYQKSGSE